MSKVYVSKRPSVNTMLEMSYATMRYALLSSPLFLNEEKMQDDSLVRQFIESAFCHKFGRFYTVFSLADSKARIDYRSRQYPFFESYHSDFVFMKDGSKYECFPSILYTDLVSKNDAYHIIDAPIVINQNALSVQTSNAKAYISGVIRRKNAQRSQFYSINHYVYMDKLREYAKFAHSKRKETGSDAAFADYLRNPALQRNVSDFIDNNIPVENLISIFYAPLLYLTGVITKPETLSKIKDVDGRHLKTRAFMFPNGVLYEATDASDSVIDFFGLEELMAP